MQAAVQVRAEKKVRVAINGFGRIGRNFLRCLETRQNRCRQLLLLELPGLLLQTWRSY